MRSMPRMGGHITGNQNADLDFALLVVTGRWREGPVRHALRFETIYRVAPPRLDPVTTMSFFSAQRSSASRVAAAS